MTLTELLVTLSLVGLLGAATAQYFEQGQRVWAIVAGREGAAPVRRAGALIGHQLGPRAYRQRHVSPSAARAPAVQAGCAGPRTSPRRW